MTAPDVDHLARTTPWSVTTWLDCWSYVQGAWPEHQQQLVWDAILALAPMAHPMGVAEALAQVCA